MATPQQLQEWIENNPDKKGTPDYQLIEDEIKQLGGDTVDEAGMLIPAEISGQEYSPQSAIQPYDVPPPVGQEMPQQPVAPQPEPTLGERVQGGLEVAKTIGTGATTGAVGMTVGFLKGVAEKLASGEFGTPEAAKYIESKAFEFADMATDTPETDLGQEYMTNVGETIGQYVPPIMPQLGNVAGGSMRGVPSHPFSKQPEMLAQSGRELQTQAQKAISPPQTHMALENIPQTGRKAEIATQLKQDPHSNEVAPYRLINDRVVKDQYSQAALRQGVKEGVVSSLSASGPVDLKQMKKMLNIQKIAMKNERFRLENRPIDVLGNSLDQRVKYVIGQKKIAGKELEVAANSLKGKSVNYSKALEGLRSRLDEQGIKVVLKDGELQVVLKGSDVEGNKPSEKLLNRVLDRLYNTDPPKGYDLHRAKQFIDTQVNFGKKGNNVLSEKTIRIVKDLRRDLNEALREYSPEYKNANTKFKDSLEAIENYAKTVGAKVDFDAPNVDKKLGQSARKLLSNYGVRPDMENSIKQLNAVSKKYGMKLNDDIMTQLMFAQELDRMFGAPADNTFKGQSAQSLATGVEVAQNSAIANTLKAGKKVADKFIGVNEQNALKAIEALLNSLEVRNK